MVRKKQHLYNLAKSMNTLESWNNFRKFRRKTKAAINQARNNHISSILSENLKENPKRFWKYVKSQRQDKIGVPPIKVNNTFYNSSKDKANILNNYFKSVFTDEDLTVLLPLWD